ncbi:hypothetical protein BJG88_08750 [Staphylococcus nepalensis]|uniref:hypothetical protein n=1 Tax=Staphylococcus nepalensis TaxID=214473 RepID=UPI000D58A505|nr:hypothetical protein [Staphylococcus nepalensis]AWI44821.1 hypothetical protein BJG88_08750 [Staphylococcus nepalensis]
MKIKTKKQLNLPQLIEWAWDNDVRGKMFPTDQNQEAGIYIATNRDFMMSNADYIKYSNTFTVEAEEEITEDTVVSKLMTTFKKTYLEGGIGYQRVRIDENYPIKLMLNKAEAHREPIETLHIVNDDGTHTLIWRDGKLVE